MTEDVEVVAFHFVPFEAFLFDVAVQTVAEFLIFHIYICVGLFVVEVYVPVGVDVEIHFVAHAVPVGVDSQYCELAKYVVDTCKGDFGFTFTLYVFGNLCGVRVAQFHHGFVNGNALGCGFQIVGPEPCYKSLLGHVVW